MLFTKLPKSPLSLDGSVYLPEQASYAFCSEDSRKRVKGIFVVMLCTNPEKRGISLAWIVNPERWMSRTCMRALIKYKGFRNDATNVV